MSRRRIHQIIPTLDQSGAEKQLTLLAAGLPRDRYEVKVTALTRGGPYADQLRAAGIEVEVLHKRFKFDPSLLWRLRRSIRNFAPQIVQTWLFAGNSYGRVAARWAGAPRIIASERCVDSWKSRLQLAIDRKCAPWTDRIVVNSQAVADFYRQQGIAAEKLVVIPNGVQRPVVNKDRDTVRRQLGIGADRPVLGFVGRLWPQKRVDDLIWAIDLLRHGGWETNLLIVGDGPERQRLEQFAVDMHVADCVRFLGHRPDAIDLINAFDLLILPSEFEGMPNVVLEAMALGVPVISTRIAGMDEVVVDDQTGLLVAARQPSELAQAVVRLIENPTLRQQFAAAGQSRVETLFSIEAMVSAYDRLYQELSE